MKGLADGGCLAGDGEDVGEEGAADNVGAGDIDGAREEGANDGLKDGRRDGLLVGCCVAL